MSSYEEHAMNPAHAVRRSIFKIIPPAAACAFAVLFAACDPQELIQWSPDGKHALVSGADGTRVVDADGKIAGDAHGAQVWLPDSRRAVGVRQVKPRDWAEYAALLGKERAAAIARAAEELLAIVRDYHGDWSEFGEADAVKQWGSSHDKLALDVAIYFLSEKHAGDVAPLLKVLREEAKGEEPLPVPIYELIVRDALPGEPAAERILLRSADEIKSLRPAPGGLTVAFAADGPDTPALQVIAVNGAEPATVDTGASQADWTPDGQCLVYAKTTAPLGKIENEPVLGTITRHRVCDDTGKILDKLDDAEVLAGILFIKERNRVACMPDGRILFASTPIQLPALDKDMPRDMTLFALRTGETPKIEGVVSAEAQKQLPERTDRFVLSPDAKRVAIPGENGEVAVLTLATGEVTQIQGKVADYGSGNKYANKSGIVPVSPAWRGSNELCHVVPAGDKNGSPKRAEVVLRALDGEPRAISKSWPDAMTDNFLPRPKEEAK
jgi:hypothetical protein